MSNNNSNGNGSGGKGNGSGGKGNCRKNCDTKPQYNNNKNRAKTVYKNNNNFEGSQKGLEGHIFECSTRQQADVYNDTIKEIIGYAGRELKHSVDICFMLDELQEKVIPDATELTEEEQKNHMKKYMKEQEFNQLIKRRTELQNNIQNMYNIVWGQCTDVLKAKLEGIANYNNMKTNMDVVALIKAIKKIVFKFEDQRYVPASLYDAKKQL